MTVCRIVSSKSDLRDFLRFPDQIHHGISEYIAPVKMLIAQTLNTKKNPFWKIASRQLFLAKRGNETVGRIAAIYHEKQKTGHFGFFDCIDDSEVAELLLNH
ncbi:MAG: hypothetical protein JJU02_02470, partial [Cryomorphaceae bacterium]|nr:hypothetical protein [Cryomorphaceae bacterium]